MVKANNCPLQVLPQEALVTLTELTGFGFTTILNILMAGQDAVPLPELTVYCVVAVGLTTTELPVLLEPDQL